MLHELGTEKLHGMQLALSYLYPRHLIKSSGEALPEEHSAERISRKD